MANLGIVLAKLSKFYLKLISVRELRILISENQFSIDMNKQVILVKLVKTSDASTEIKLLSSLRKSTLFHFNYIKKDSSYWKSILI